MIENYTYVVFITLADNKLYRYGQCKTTFTYVTSLNPMKCAFPSKEHVTDLYKVKAPGLGHGGSNFGKIYNSDWLLQNLLILSSSQQYSTFN
jgi:hypothetical protein